MSVGLAFVASTISRIGIPSFFAQKPASAFPTLPEGTMKPGSTPCSRW